MPQVQEAELQKRLDAMRRTRWTADQATKHDPVTETLTQSAQQTLGYELLLPERRQRALTDWLTGVGRMAQQQPASLTLGSATDS